MAIPPTVVTGETISVTWGNSVRDWAVGVVDFGMASEVVLDTSITSTFETGATVTFTKPAAWVTYKIMAWGVVHFTGSLSVTAAICQARVVLSTNGTTMHNTTSQSDAAEAVTVGANHTVTGLTGNQAVSIQYARAGSNGEADKLGSTVNYMAIRLS